MFKNVLFFHQSIKHWCVYANQFCLFLIIKLLKHHHGVLAFVQIAAGKIERLLRAYLPVATEINAIDKDNALAPFFHVKERVANLVKFKRAKIKCRLTLT